jgi:uncharacterized membrane protein
VTTCSLLEAYRHFGGMYCLHLQSRRVSEPIIQQEASSGLCLLIGTCCLLNFTQTSSSSSSSSLAKQTFKYFKRVFSKCLLDYIGFDVLTTVFMKNTIFWDIKSCIPLKVNRRFGVTCHILFQSRRIIRPRNKRDGGGTRSTLRLKLKL